ncbi:oligopeptide ABC transporter permease [Solibacillus sp. FSL H8-0538]|uniref:oligopeptide ABC transporter permease n=1 Tax=Solibacillus sp. FSL H8-0538 TaxID=2921400 RepID=UPI0030FB51D8
MATTNVELQQNAPNSQQPATTLSKKEQGYFGMVMKRFFKHKMAVFGLISFIALTLMAIFAPFIAPYDPYAMNSVFGGAPSADHLLGTDQIGRDVLSRLIYASRVSLVVGIGAVSIFVIIGTIVGAVSAYFGGWIDMVFMRITDVFMAFPALMLILVIVSIVGPSLTNLILILGLLGWPAVARLVRGSVLSLKEMDFVKAAVALGYSTPRILFLHILPNAIAPVLVYATFGVASTILMEAALSFLGLGVRPPTASWGNMLTDAQSLTVLTEMPWLWIPPGLMIVIAVLSINFVGDGLRDAMDPKNMN